MAIKKINHYIGKAFLIKHYALLMVLTLTILFVPGNAFAVIDPGPTATPTPTSTPATDDQNKPLCDPADEACKDPALTCAEGDKTKCDIVVKYINPFISFLSIFAGIAFTIALMIGGIRYITAGGDPGAVSKARSLIAKTIFALLGYILLWAFINWLQPGGISQ